MVEFSRKEGIILLDLIGVIADITGILGFILSIVLLIRSESLRNEILLQKIDYSSQQSEICNRLIHLSETMQRGSNISLKTIRDLRQELYQYLLTFDHLLKWKDKHIIKQTISLFDKEFSPVTKNRLLKNLDYLIARFHKRED